MRTSYSRAAGAFPAAAGVCLVKERSDYPDKDTLAGADFQPREWFLQVLWNEGCLHGGLRTVGGLPLRILAPGVWNLAAGPDFLGAELEIGGRLLHGDVEIHRTPADWFRHGHHRDDRYAGVILHVVWDMGGADGAGMRGLPECLVLRGALGPSWEEVSARASLDGYPYAQRVASGECALRWALTDDGRVRRILRQAGLARLAERTAMLHRAAIERGFDQAVYEQLFEALGYKANRSQFRRLAEAVPLERLAALPDAEARRALLFGSAGLLPDPSSGKFELAGRGGVGRLWDLWWRHGGAVLELGWQRAGVRPANLPEARLAAGAVLLERLRLQPARWLAELVEGGVDAASLRQRLAALLVVGGQVAPSWRTSAGRPRRLLGRDRANDMIINVILPYWGAAAKAAGNSVLAAFAEDVYLAMPALQQNRRLLEVAHRLLVPPSRLREVARLACEQQGLLQIHAEFCRFLHNNCGKCPFSRAAGVALLGRKQ